MSNLRSVKEVLDHLTGGWGERDVYHLEQEDLALFLLQPGVDVSTKGNGDGTETVTVLFQGKQFMCTRQAVSK